MRRSIACIRVPHACAVFLLAAAFIAHGAHAHQNPQGLAKDGTALVADQLRLPEPPQVGVHGFIGARFALNEQNRLLKVDEVELLGGFQHRPGSHPWIGEHVGKWLHAASLTYANTGSVPLREKLDRVAKALMATQEKDGYLGTYAPDRRFGLFKEADWDVWVHKYDLIGLLSYCQYTGNRDALETCKRVGDLLINTFGKDKKSIIDAGTHVGMAATSVLEPVVLLYRATGEKRYLGFAEYIVSSWEEEKGPRILTALLAGTPVNKVANGKAYEMTSNLCGLCELYRATGKKAYLAAVLNAWKDIAANRLYITGSGSSHELWQADYHLPNDVKSNICETCVTVTWMQLNMHLLRLTGEAKYAEEFEKTLFNHLLAAQHPDGADWCYYTALNGEKRYDRETHCCHSSGPRGVALAPLTFYSAADDGVTVNLFGNSTATVPLPGGGAVTLQQTTTYPLAGDIAIAVRPEGAKGPFAICLRVPKWTPKAAASINGEAVANPDIKDGWLTLKREWKPGDTIACVFDMAPRLIPGDHENEGRVAVMYGPLVLALDQASNGAPPIDSLTIASPSPGAFALERVGESGIFKVNGLTLTPYYAAGLDKSPFNIWIKKAS